jgi:hypothetical protein
MKIISRISLASLALLATVPAHAYVDPGTGSMVIQMIVGGILAAGFMLKSYYYQIKRRINKLLGRETSADAEASDVGADVASSEPAARD